MEPENHGEQKTHRLISEDWVGRVKGIKTDEEATVVLRTVEPMRVDEKGLVHGGFTFGLADYAAMVAVNDPFVVLLSSQVQFLKPVAAGDLLTAQALVKSKEGRKRKVWVEVRDQDEKKVLEGEFLCLALARHVLDK